MAEWENTVYVRRGEPRQVLEALDALAAAEGMRPAADPPRRERDPATYEPMQYLGALQNDLWGAIVVPGSAGWCVIKTAPLDLLAERAAGAPRMRLADLCLRLQCEALHFAAYDGSILLTEAMPDGDVVMSGYYVSGSNPLCRYGERIDEACIEPGLRRLQLPTSIDFSDGAAAASAALGAALGGQQAAARDNLVSVMTLVEHRPLAPLSGLMRYWRWSGDSRQQQVRLPRRGDG
jgi:hypothetical protein